MFEKFNFTEMLNATSEMTNYQAITTISKNSFVIPLGLIFIGLIIILLIYGLTATKLSEKFWRLFFILLVIFVVIWISFFTGLSPYFLSLPYS